MRLHGAEAQRATLGSRLRRNSLREERAGLVALRFERAAEGREDGVARLVCDMLTVQGTPHGLVAQVGLNGYGLDGHVARLAHRAQEGAVVLHGGASPGRRPWRLRASRRGCRAL